MQKLAATLCIGLVIFSSSAYGQKVQIPSCNDTFVHASLVSKNTTWEQKGYKLHTTKNLLMLNGGIQPVTLEVKAGKQYVVNYIPQPSSKKVKMTIVDKDNKEVAETRGKQGEQLSMTFTSSYDGVYYIFLSQKLKGVKEICGGISILEK